MAIRAGMALESAAVVASMLGVSEIDLKVWAWHGHVPYCLVDEKAVCNFSATVIALQAAIGRDEMAGIAASKIWASEGDCEVVEHEAAMRTPRPVPPRPPVPVSAVSPNVEQEPIEDWSYELCGVSSRWDSVSLRRVYSIIRASGQDGVADFQGAERLGLASNSYTPRRVELREAGVIVVKPKARGHTPAGKTASVWIATASLSREELSRYRALTAPVTNN